MYTPGPLPRHLVVNDIENVNCLFSFMLVFWNQLSNFTSIIRLSITFLSSSKRTFWKTSPLCHDDREHYFRRDGAAGRFDVQAKANADSKG